MLRTLEKKYAVTIGDPSITDAHARYAPKMLEATEIMQRAYQKILPDVLGVTRILHAAGVAQAVCTNNDLAISDNGLKLAGLAGIFPKGRTYSADDVFRLNPNKTAAELIAQNIGFKPAGDLYRHALREESCEGNNAVAIEDSVTGVTAAKDAGIGMVIGCLGVHTAAGKSQSELNAHAAALRKAGATHIIASYAELLPLLIEHGTPEISAAITREVARINATEPKRVDDPIRNAIACAERQTPHAPIGTPVIATSVIGTFFDADDGAFLARMFEAYPHIQSNFEHYLSMNPAHRQSEALEALNYVPRTGWKNLGIPNPESVYDHTMHLCKRARETSAKAKLDPEHLVAVALVHDLPEAIVGDFTPTDTISNDDKHRLESLAARVIFADDPQSLARYHEYEAKKTPSAQLLSDLDKFDACEQALIYEAHHPALTVGAFERFVGTSRPKLKTDLVKAMLDDLEKNAEAIRDKALRDHRGPIADRIAQTYGAEHAAARRG